MKVVVDANIIISGLRFGGPPRRILDLCSQGTIAGFTSDTALEEVKEVLLTKFGLTLQEWTIVREAIQENLAIVPVLNLPEVPGLRDPRDSHIFAAADTCQADAIMSGDKDLLTLGDYRGIPVVSAREFIQRHT